MIELHPSEHILLVRRKHWFVLFAQTLPLAFLFVLPFALWRALTELSLPPEVTQVWLDPIASLDASLIIFGLAWWFLVLWMRFFTLWTDYYLDAWIITNERIIDVEQLGFFRRDVSTFRFEQIQDISVDVHGLIPTLLDFGDLHVQTAGQSRALLIRGVASPNTLRDFISHKHDEIVGRVESGK